MTVRDEDRLTAVAVALSLQSRKRAGMAEISREHALAYLHHWKYTAPNFYAEILEDAAAVLECLDRVEEKAKS